MLLPGGDWPGSLGEFQGSETLPPQDWHKLKPVKLQYRWGGCGGQTPEAFSLVIGLFQKLLVRERELLVALLIPYRPWCLVPSLHAPIHTWLSTNWTWGALIIKMKKVMKSLGRAATNFCHSILSQVKLMHTTLRPFCVVCACACMPVSSSMLSEARGRCREFFLTALLYCPETGSLSKSKVHCFC